ncbi:MAG: 3'(2'),5'-bisphosphate nucleotidase CysQ [Verrucomicrobia bacterium]|nr:3'(2'),5'-bisphosphate nucleotidase CysQ [Verrucomicrobiota bacterium]
MAIARQAGEKIMDIYDRISDQDDLTIQSKADHSPLTEADLAAHHCIIEGLKSLDPQTPVISEESALPEYEVRKQWTRFWMVDPLDGTKEFIKRNGEFTVNIALIEHNVPTKGVVYAPALNLLYFAEAESGSFKQELKLDLTQNSNPNSKQDSTQDVPKDTNKSTPIQLFSIKADPKQPLRLVESRSHGSEALENYIREHNLQISSRVASGSSLKICLVAEGKADIYPRMAPTMEWDVAAGDAVYRYSGNPSPHSSELQFNKEHLLNPSFVYGF